MAQRLEWRESHTGKTPEEIIGMKDLAHPDIIQAAKQLVKDKEWIRERNKSNGKLEDEKMPSYRFLDLEQHSFTSLWTAYVDGKMELKMVPNRRGRMQGSASFSRKSGVSREKMILWFISSKGSRGAKYSEIQRFIAELNGHDYDMTVWEEDWHATSRFRDTGKRIWALPGQTYEQAMKSHNGEYIRDRCVKMETVDERLPRQGPIKMRKMRIFRGYYSTALSYGGDGILDKWCEKRGSMWHLTDVGRDHMMTAEQETEPELPAPPAAPIMRSQRLYAEHHEEV